MRYFDDEKKLQGVATEQPEQTVLPPEGGPVQTVLPETGTATTRQNPFADYQKQQEQQYANTLADIRKRRKELEEKYQPQIDRQKRVMKIMALGKLLGQLGQLAGGGAGTPVVDKDPYQINAWKNLDQMRQEQMYYNRQLDAEERAATQSMQTGLNRLADRRMQYDMQTERLQAQADLNREKQAHKEKMATLQHAMNMELQNAKTEDKKEEIRLKYSQMLAHENLKHQNRLEAYKAKGAVDMDVDDYRTHNKILVGDANADRKVGQQTVTVKDDGSVSTRTITAGGTPQAGNYQPRPKKYEYISNGSGKQPYNYKK